MKISIIIPVYNEERYLAPCLDSVLAQSYEDIEIILVDDGSTDRSWTIGEEYKSRDRRIVLIHKDHHGLSEARNAGIRQVTGDYVCFMDSDDVLSADFLKMLIETGLKFNADIVECDLLKFTTDEELLHLKGETEGAIVEEFNRTEALKLLITDRLRSLVWNKLYSRKLIGSVLFRKGKIHEDQFWTHQIFAKADKLVHLRLPLYYYRIHPDSIMGRKYRLERLHDIEAFDEQVLFMKENFPELTGLALQRLYYNVLKHYNLLKNSGLKEEADERKKLIGILKKYNTKTFIQGWGKKETLWFKFMVHSPALCYPLMRTLKGIN